MLSLGTGDGDPRSCSAGLRLFVAVPHSQQARLQPQMLVVPAVRVQGRVGCPGKGGHAVNDCDACELFD